MSIGFVYGVIYDIYSSLVDPTDFLALGVHYPLRISFTTEVLFLASTFAHALSLDEPFMPPPRDPFMGRFGTPCMGHPRTP